MWQYNDGGTELYHYGVKGMRWGHRKAISAFTKMISDRTRRSNESFSDRMAYRDGGSEAVRRNQVKRKRLSNYRKATAYHKASGKKKAEMVLKYLGSSILEGPKDIHGQSHNKPQGNI